MGNPHDFILTMASLPPNRTYDDCYQALAWKVVYPPEGNDPWDTQRRTNILHCPTVRVRATTKEEFLADIAKIAEKIWDQSAILVDDHFKNQQAHE
jgi:hypothetical protein